MHLLQSVRVPASTSNLGPGFDFLGLALELTLEVEILGKSDARVHQLERLSGFAEDWPATGNLFIQAFERASAAAEIPPLRFAVHSEIPLCRGLGSSGAAIAAGLFLGALVATGETPDVRRLLDIGYELEGHPDNSTASLLGGCTLAVPVGEGGLQVVRPPLHPGLVAAVAWPSEPLSTEFARGALPQEVPFSDAVENPRRLALLLEGLRRGDPELLRSGVEDRLHTPYRLPLIRGAAEALEAARDAGAWLATISGSGSALIALHGSSEEAEALRAAMVTELARKNASAEGRVLRPDPQGARRGET